VSALLGFVGGEFKPVGSLYQALYVVPLIATFFDLLIVGEHFSIRRAATFLRLNSSSQLERAYERFVSHNRDVFFKFGSTGFTLISYFASIVLLRKQNQMHSWLEWVWFSGLFVTFVSASLYSNHRLKDLDRRESSDTD
jgi:Ca2+/Na+ antiporter